MERVAHHVISIGGGKGGVGKSVVAANFAVALAMSGRQVVLVDADLGAANQHTLFGLKGTGPTLQSFLEHENENLEAARVDTGVRRLSLVRGAAAVYGAANPTHGQKERLVRHVLALDAEIIVVDVGAGTGFNQLDLFNAAEIKVLVMTPQLTSVENAYGFVKGAVYRALMPVLRSYGFEFLLEGNRPGSETARLSAVLKEAIDCSPKLEAEVREVLRSLSVHLFGNMVNTTRETPVFAAVGKMMRDFLGIDSTVLGFARMSLGVHASINERRPVLVNRRDDEASVTFWRAARSLVEHPHPHRAGVRAA
jgi:flagellar biosynthesis protein FlhG